MEQNLTPKIVDRATRKKDIAQRSLSLFAERGFEAASMSQIAEAVGVKKATIYDYFANKDELVMEALKVWFEQLLEGMELLLAGTTDPIEQLHIFIDSSCAAMEETFAMQLTLSVTQLMAKEENVEKFQFARALLARIRKMFEGIMLEGISRGVFRTECARDVDKITVNFLAYLDGIGLHYYLFGHDAFDLKTQMDFYLERLLSQIVSESVEARPADTTT